MFVNLNMNSKIFILLLTITFMGCQKVNSEYEGANCETLITVDTSHGECNIQMGYDNQVYFSISGDKRVITANNIPEHKVGLFGNAAGSLNPNSIQEQNSTYEIDANPIQSSSITELINNGPEYSFGIMFNGIELDPVAAEPWPHDNQGEPPGPPTGDNINWEWNLEASMVQIGLDCNNAHVQPTGKYHYHGVPTLYLENLAYNQNSMVHLGYAADGFPIYLQSGYSIANDTLSELIDLQSSYRMKTGNRPGDGNSAPCGEYTGVYTADYEYVEGLGDLDECNGRAGVTQKSPNGTYYYVITDEYPGIPRCFVGIPSNDFKLGPP